jgi:DNA-binding MarR family transcriptional regulator
VPTVVRNEREALAELIIRYGARMYRLLDEALGSISVPLTLAQYGIMDRTAEADVTMSEHARAASRTLSSISTTVNGLVRQGLLYRRRDEGDGRVVYLHLTDVGRRVLEEARAARRELGEWVIEVGGVALLPVYAELNAHYERLGERVGALSMRVHAPSAPDDEEEPDELSAVPR